MFMFYCCDHVSATSLNVLRYNWETHLMCGIYSMREFRAAALTCFSYREYLHLKSSTGGNQFCFEEDHIHVMKVFQVLLTC